MKAAAVIVAGGEGRRMKAGTNKIFMDLGGRSILEWSLRLFDSISSVEQVVLVARAADVKACQTIAAGFPKLKMIVPGGETRHRSEFSGVKAIAADIDADDIGLVLVHDAARPFASVSLVERLMEERGDTVGCIPGLPLPTTVVSVRDGWISGYPAGLWAVQTPQAFEATWLLEAHNKAARQGFIGTDTASVVEWAGGPVRVIHGEPDNVKITTPDDLERARRIAALR